MMMMAVSFTRSDRMSSHNRGSPRGDADEGEHALGQSRLIGFVDRINRLELHAQCMSEDVFAGVDFFDDRAVACDDTGAADQFISPV